MMPTDWHLEMITIIQKFSPIQKFSYIKFLDICQVLIVYPLQLKYHRRNINVNMQDCSL